MLGAPVTFNQLIIIQVVFLLFYYYADEQVAVLESETLVFSIWGNFNLGFFWDWV